MIMDNQIVSIVMCTRNNASTIERALKSLCNSNRKPNKIVVGDNNSGDKTYKILCDLLGAELVKINDQAGLPPKFDGQINGVSVTIFKSKQFNRSRILNYCFSLLPLDTTIIGLLDPTDWYEPSKIEKSVQIFNRYDSVCCVVNDYNEQCYPGDKLLRRFNKSFSHYKLTNECLYDCNFLIRVNAMRILKSGFDNNLTDQEHYDLILRLSYVGLIYHIPEALHNCSLKQKKDTAVIDRLIKQKIIQQKAKSVQSKK